MKNIHIISEDDTKKLLHMEDVIATIEGVYREKSTGTGEIFPMVFHDSLNFKFKMEKQI